MKVWGRAVCFQLKLKINHHRKNLKLLAPAVQSILWETVWRLHRRLKIAPTYDPAITLPHMYPRSMKPACQEDTVTVVRTTAVSAVAKRRP